MASGAKSVWLEIQIFLISLVLSVAITAVLTMVYAPIVEFISVTLNVTKISAAGSLSLSTVILWGAGLIFFIRPLRKDTNPLLLCNGKVLLFLIVFIILIYINLISAFEIGEKNTSLRNLLFINEEFVSSLSLPLHWMITINVFYVLFVSYVISDRVREFWGHRAC